MNRNKQDVRKYHSRRDHRKGLKAVRVENKATGLGTQQEVRLFKTTGLQAELREQLME